MKVCLVSDLHVEHNQQKIIWPEADVLMIAGDTANTIGDDLKILRKVSKQYRHVVSTDGNHTHYSNKPQKRTVEETIARIRKQLPENVHYLGHGYPHVELDGVHFIGCNGWYSFDAMGDPIENRSLWKQVMNDDKWIGFSIIDQQQPWDRAESDAALINNTLMGIKDDKPIVVMTHTAPHHNMVTWKGDLNWDRSNSFYINSHMEKILMSPVGQRVSIWQNGHTHHRRDRMLGNVLCVCNPRGYPRENPNWQPVVLDIG